ncbi:MAG: hypothetical protein R6U46_06940 [Marinilabilia sp.]
MMKRLMHILFLSCFKATELIEKKFHITLSFKERLQLKMHKSMCSACRLYEKQSSVLDKALFHPERLNGDKEDLTAFKKELLKKLEERHN